MAAKVIVEEAGVSVSMNELRANIAACIGPPAHFAWVAEQDGAVCAAVIAHTARLPWSAKQSADIAMLCSKAPGEGMRLLSKAMKWIYERPVIKTACIELLSPDERLKRVLRRMGFARETTNMVWVR
jgi:hypothetical protein